MLALHPATRLLLWLFFLMVIQGLDGSLLLMALLLPLLGGRRVLRRGGKLA